MLEAEHTPRVTFEADMAPADVMALTDNLSPGDRVQFWSTFESTPEATTPYILTHKAVDNVAAVLAGAKPAALLLAEERYLDPAVVDLIAAEADRYEELGLSQDQVVDRSGNRLHFFGKKDNVEKLTLLYQGLIASGESSPTPEFDRQVGELFGYPSAAIEAHIERTSGVEEEVQAGPLRRWLGRLAARF